MIYVMVWEGVSFGAKPDPLYSLHFDESDPAHLYVADKWGALHDISGFEEV